MADAYTNVDQIRSGEIAGFDVTVTGPQQSISSYAISASYERSQIIKPEFIALSVGSYYLDANGHYHLTGKITNEGSSPTKFVKASGIFFDSTKKIIDTKFGYTTPTNLLPGHSAPIELLSSSPNAMDIKFVYLVAQSDQYSIMNIPRLYSTPSVSTTLHEALAAGNTSPTGGTFTGGDDGVGPIGGGGTFTGGDGGVGPIGGGGTFTGGDGGVGPIGGGGTFTGGDGGVGPIGGGGTFTGGDGGVGPIGGGGDFYWR